MRQLVAGDTRELGSEMCLVSRVGRGGHLLDVGETVEVDLELPHDAIMRGSLPKLRLCASMMIFSESWVAVPSMTSTRPLFWQFTH